MPSNLTVVIPTAGLGRRMKSYGPKALIEVNRRQTVLSRQLAILKQRFPDAEFVVVVGFEAERVIRSLPAWVKVVENECYESTNVARSVAMGLRASATEGPVLVVYGDLVFTPALFAGMPTDRSLVVVDTQGQFRDFEVGCTVVRGVVTQFAYGLPAKWAQVALLTGRELASFRRLASARERRRHFGYEVLNEVVERGGVLAAHEPAGLRVVEIDTSKDIELARQL